MSSIRKTILLALAGAAAVYIGMAGSAGYSARADDGEVQRLAATTSGVTLSATERDLLALINRARKRRGLKVLVLRASLYRSAKAHSREMIRRDYFSHLSTTGSSPQARAKRAGYASGYSSWRVAEVIAWGSGSAGSPSKIFQRWMRSPGHRTILLGKRWRDVGVGRAKGTFQGLSGVRMYTVDVGRRTR